MSALAKLLSGAQSGAEALLDPGEYVLGSSDEADLVLIDAAVLPRHARLRIGADAWIVEALDGAEVRVGGLPISAPCEIPPYGVVTLGGVSVALGPDGQWETLPSVPAATLPGPAAAPVAEEPGEPAAGRRDDDMPEPVESRVPWLRWLAAAVLVPAALIAAYAHFHTRTPDPVAVAADALRRRGIEATYPAPPNLPAGTVGLSTAPDGGVAVTGLVSTREERDDILGAVSGDPATSSLRSVEEELAAAGTELAERYPGARLTRGDHPFAIRLSGIVESQEDGAGAYRLARSALDPRISVRRALLIWREMRHEAEREAGRLGVPDPRFTLNADRVALEAALWPDARQRDGILDALRDDFGPEASRLFAQALDSPPPEPPRPPVPPLPEIQPIWPVAPGPSVSVAKVVVRRVEEPAQPAAPPSPSSPAPSPPPPPVKTWRVAGMTPNGFVDQAGIHHGVGEVLFGETRLAGVWKKGVALQRGEETFFVNEGEIITETLTLPVAEITYSKDDSDSTGE